MSRATSYRLLILDLRGTLLTPDHQIHPSNIEALGSLMEQHVRVSLVTERSPHHIADVLKQIRPNAPLLYFDGALIRDAITNEVITRRGVPTAGAITALEAGASVGLQASLVYEDQIVVSDGGPASSTDWDAGAPKAVVPDLVRALRSRDLGPLEVLLRGDADCLDAVYMEFETRGTGECEFFFRGADTLVTRAAGVSRAAGVRALVEHLGLTLDETVAFGDGPKDLSLLECCGLGVAMGNASESLRSQADVVIDHNSTDAIAYYLRSEFSARDGVLTRRA